MSQYNIAGVSEFIKDSRTLESLIAYPKISTRNNEYENLQDQNQSLLEENSTFADKLDVSYKITCLKFLDRMIAAGNYNLLNEVQSIIKELRGAKIIY